MKLLKIKILFFIILIYISFFIERNLLICKNRSLYTLFISLIHHIFSVYLYFGSFIFNLYLFNIILALLTIFGWIIFNNRCFLTIYYNKLCNIPVEKNFNDIIYFFNKKLKIKHLHYYIISLIFLYNFYFLCVFNYPATFI
jgi:hypothetical protein